MPLLIRAYIGGPDPRHTGAPGDETCNTAGCHTGTPVNGGPGNVAIAFPNNSLTYTPGTRQRWTVTVTGGEADRRAFGFQATARLESNLSGGQAGSFHTTDSRTQVLCDDGGVRPASGCAARFNVEFIEHTNANATNTFTFEWEPPATNVGNVRVYVAGNAANGNIQNTGDKIYTASYTLTPATTGGGGNGPTITAVGEAFNFTSGVAPGSWTAIFGSNLAANQRDWNGAIQGTTLPTSLDGVSVTVNNRPATVFFISQAQINVLTPNDIGTGPVNVVVTNAAGASQPSTVTAVAVKPAFYAPFAQDGRFFVTAVSLDGTYVGKRGVDPRVTRGARPGEVLQIFATGFGATNPVVSTTQIFTGAPAIVAPVRIRFGQTVATIAGNGNLVSPGLYQFNVTVPDTLQSGDAQIIAEVGATTSSDAVYLTIERP